MRHAHPRTIVRALAFAVPLVAAILLPRPATAQQGQLYISVLDTQGKPVTDLTAADFGVTVDGAECKIVKVETVSKPMRLSVMIDNGPATTKELATIRSAFKALIMAVPEGIPVELITIAPQPRFLEKETTDHQKLLAAIDRLSPDSGAGLFLDALLEAGNRVDKDKGAYYPVYLMLASDFGRNQGSYDRDYQKLQQQVLKYGITVNFILFHGGGDREGSVAGAVQTEVGMSLTKLSGGKYDNINSSTRLVTLLPELVKGLDKSNARQMAEYRITYEQPKGSKPAQQLGASLKSARDGLVPQLSIDGHMPPQ